ncbi:nuclear transport factor 2 family protein [Aureispira sp. CCB-E]|uniref:nuclear transport factor 2 family protein n=1 Tax=Aureispira sp. CCB-E TaxID=3051121 RepID=UPI0028695730|nr:nuclear transport factor 2 family protein [Aureispira sp. CCB-E]WMX13492.1 nuclear transport factor 2 family protein [Aureispira sp. CCB-E]
MKYNLIFTLLIALWSNAIQAQSKGEIRKVIDNFFVAMEAKDTIALDQLMHDQCVLFTTLTQNGTPKIQAVPKASFLTFMKRVIAKKYVYDERLWNYDISQDDNLAIVWTEYTMFTGATNQLSHCGVNVFTLGKSEKGTWLITNITDTRRKENCITEETVVENKGMVENVLNHWHEASATADADAFFGAMTEDGIYLGTDASERWLRDELREWSKFAFERDTAWAFTASKREIYFSNNQKTAWFEEMLDTQMGTCRGSGVLVKKDGVWKIKHYDLAIMVPNDLVKDFKKLVAMGGLPKSKKEQRAARRKKKK